MPTTQATDISRTHEMYALYQEDVTLERVGKAYGITRERVRQLFGKAGLQTRSRAQSRRLKFQVASQNTSRYIDEHRHEIIQRFRDTRNIPAIAEQHDLSIPTVKTILKQALAHHEYRALRYKPRAKEYTDDDLTGFLREAGHAQDGILTVASYKHFASGRRRDDGTRYPTYQTYINRFGSWQNALHAAGMKANVPYPWGGKTFDLDECLTAVRAVHQKLGKPPTRDQYDHCARESEGSLPSVTTVSKRCGGWIATLQMAAG